MFIRSCLSLQACEILSSPMETLRAQARLPSIDLIPAFAQLQKAGQRHVQVINIIKVAITHGVACIYVS